MWNKLDKPAFPQALRDDDGKMYSFSEWEGMGLRDYFAAKALNGLLSWIHPPFMEIDFKLTADRAYQMADKMMEARNATNS